MRKNRFGGLLFVLFVLLIQVAFGQVSQLVAQSEMKPNIVILFADDISAREIPIYGSSVWSSPMAENTSDLKYRAKTPVLNKIAEEGCWISTAWAATVCNPSRAMMMSGRYAYQTKWWNNKDKGYGPDEEGEIGTWPVYMSSPLLMGVVAQKSGYGTFWAGKTQMEGSWGRHGFDEGCFTPGGYGRTDNPYTDFRHEYIKKEGKRIMINADTGEPCDTYLQNGWYWAPHVSLFNHPSAEDSVVWWPNTPKARKEYGLHTYGPDVELEYAFDFMERKHKEGKPFLIYHTTHLGHDAFDWFNPDSKSKWPGAPIVEWNGKKYKRTKPHITGDNGVYDTHNSITGPGIHHHINYIDYQIWLYQQKFKELGIEDNTIFIFSADNGTSKYGKNSGVQQRGCHIPLIIYAPGMTKHGRQDVLVSIADVMPTLAEIMGFEFPEDYKVDGVSMVPFLFGDEEGHREWIYTYRGPEQLIRGANLLKDGNDRWWDVSVYPDDLTSFPEYKSMEKAGKVMQQEADELKEVLPQYDYYFDAYNAPGVDKEPAKRPRYYRKSKDMRVW